MKFNIVYGLLNISFALLFLITESFSIKLFCAGWFIGGGLSDLSKKRKKTK